MIAICAVLEHKMIIFEEVLGNAEKCHYGLLNHQA